MSDLAQRLFEESQDDTESLYWKAWSEINQLRQQLEQAEARIAELESAGRKAARHWSDAQSGFQSEELLDFREIIDKSHGKAWLLRKQAEAVEAEAKEWREVTNKHLTRGFSPDFIADEIAESAQRLRQQAEELEE